MPILLVTAIDVAVAACLAFYVRSLLLRGRRAVPQPARRGAETFTAASASATLSHDGRLGLITVQPAEISLDSAALLVNDLIGGPVAWVRPDSVTILPVTGAVRRSRRITVIAAEHVEACEVLREAGELLARDPEFAQMTRLLPRAYRWHDGELVPVIWRSIGGEVGTVGQEEWADGDLSRTAAMTRRYRPPHCR